MYALPSRLELQIAVDIVTSGKMNEAGIDTV